MNFYQQCQNSYRRLKQSEDSQEKREGLRTMEAFHAYFHEGTYTRFQDKQVVLEDWNQPLSEAARKLGVPDKSLNWARAQIVKDLENKLTMHFLEDLKAEDWVSVQDRLYLAERFSFNIAYFDRLLMTSSRNQFYRCGQNSGHGLTVADCGKELLMVKHLSCQEVTETYKLLSFKGKTRLAYLIKVITGIRGSRAERHQIAQYFRHSDRNSSTKGKGQGHEKPFTDQDLNDSKRNGNMHLSQG
ncbi:hypothetical protein [Sporolactobacillus pectinivorans]|uniref:hypothetical protein n=1 Tax=Sporolactobacillus pectinivorans TaxID=1591408 RepID=UPI000C2567E4|nr:hypothetical protein [Sporolactobacillus pectinivorans]